MKLVFYSGGTFEENADLDSACLSLLDSHNPTFCFIPNNSYEGEYEFRQFVEHYQSFGISRFLYFPIDVPQDNVLLGEVFHSDLIHIGGGNTYYCLHRMRKIGFVNLLREYALQGGVLTGLSAGAIVMTPTIGTAGYPSFDKDENEEGLRNLKSLNLVKFEFFPHYKNSIRYDTELRRQSKLTKYPIYAACDGAGIIRKRETTTFLGKIWCFVNGQKFQVNS